MIGNIFDRVSNVTLDDTRIWFKEKFGYKYISNEEFSERMGVIFSTFIVWCVLLWGVITVTCFGMSVWMLIVLQLIKDNI